MQRSCSCGMTVEAKKVANPGELSKFVGRLITDYTHDYGTICHAVAASAIAGANCMNHSPQGGITGFQAGAIFWEFYGAWMHEKGPARLQRMDDLLYPQMEHKFKTISPDTWKYVQEEAKKNLADKSEVGVHPDVAVHWQSIVAGKIPFGLQIEER
jgi:hypothetical protein